MTITGENCCARGDFAWSVELDETMVRADIRDEEEEGERCEQMSLGL